MEVTDIGQKVAPCGAKLEKAKSFASFVEPKITL